MRLAVPRLGDAGTRAILEFVGKNDRVVKKSEKPEFGADDSEEDAEDTASEAVAESEAEEATEDSGEEESKEDKS